MRNLHGLLVGLLLASCAATAPAPTNIAPVESLPNSSAIALESPLAAETTLQPVEIIGPEKANNRSRYALDVLLDYDVGRIQVQQVVDYLNQSGTQLEELVFVVEAARLGGEFAISRIAIEDHAIQNATLQGDLMRLPLPQPLPPAERLRISLSYTLQLPDQAGPLGYTARQQNWADWYPFVPPHQAAEGWRLHPAGTVGEHLVYESADFAVRILVRDRADVIIGAPAPATRDGDVYLYSLTNARRFAWSASPDYVMLDGSEGSIPIRAYVFNGHEEAGRAALEGAQEALEVFTELYGDYPYESLSIIEGEFPDGMESDGLFWLSSNFFEGYTGNPQNYLITLTAHETAHNWWFGQVGNDAALEPWLDEALCTYSELLFYQRQHPDLIAWWWRFRILDYSPVGAVDSSIYDHEAFAPYVQAVYLRGALFLDELRRLMGDEAFFAFLADHAQANRGQIASADDFFARLAEHVAADIQPLLDEYFGGSDD